METVIVIRKINATVEEMQEIANNLTIPDTQISLENEESMLDWLVQIVASPNNPNPPHLGRFATVIDEYDCSYDLKIDDVIYTYFRENLSLVER